MYPVGSDHSLTPNALPTIPIRHLMVIWFAPRERMTI
jgi:hypothetical protein